MKCGMHGDDINNIWPDETTYRRSHRDANVRRGNHINQLTSLFTCKEDSTHKAVSNLRSNASSHSFPPSRHIPEGSRKAISSNHDRVLVPHITSTCRRCREGSKLDHGQIIQTPQWHPKVFVADRKEQFLLVFAWKCCTMVETNFFILFRRWWNSIRICFNYVLLIYTVKRTKCKKICSLYIR